MRTLGDKNFRGAVALSALLALAAAGTAQAAGTLTFYIQGEKLATEGFIAPQLTKDGWSLTFAHIWVTLADITAHQTTPPFDAGREELITATQQVTLPGVYTLDLVSGGEHGRLRIDHLSAPLGHYNALSWRMVTAAEGVAQDTVMLFIGTATRGDQSIPFQLAVEEPHAYLCGEFIGEERKGFVTAAGEADLEITFHLDHLFGRADKPANDPMNRTAPGFAPFASGTGVQRLSLHGLHLGHVGEGHCRVLWS